MAGPTMCVVSGGVATITLDAQERRNAFGRALMDSLMGDFEAALADPAVRVIVLTNAGPVFSAGADVKEGHDPDIPWPLPYHQILDAVDRSPKPVVARVAGHAAGGAACLVAMCDISVVVDTARIGITEVRLGMPPVDVVAYLASRVPYRFLLEALLGGEMMPAERAVQLGLANVAVPAADLDATVQRYVDTLLESGPNALATTKRWLQTMVSMTPDQAKALGREAASDSMFNSAEGAEGIAAFIEKRAASWVPRR